MRYSKQQLNAINHVDGPALVLAVPGAGKTTVLLERINNLINKKGVDPSSILVMTFSKTQAVDMEDRFYKKYESRGLTFATIHSFAYGIVRSAYRKEGKSVNLIESSKNFNKFSLLERFHYQINNSRITDEDMEEFFRVSGFIKNTLLDYDMYKKSYGPSIKNFEKLFDAYESFKHENDLIDFDDMLVIALKALQNDESMLSALQDRYKYVQIDEGQDTSLVQLKIIELVALPQNNLFIVADDDQSIYGFRGADSRKLLSFKSVYPDASIYLMEDNYRSAKNIVALSNRVIKNNKNRYHKELNSINQLEDKINIINSKNTYLQTKHVVENAKNMAENGESVAILYRNNISSINYISAFNDVDDFFIKDGKMAFYSQFILKDLIDILNFAIDANDLDSFARIFYKFNMYLKKDFIHQIQMMDPNLSIIDRLEQCDGINRFYIEKIDLLRYYMNKIASLKFEKAIDIIFGELGYIDYLKELSRRNKTPMITYSRVIDTIINISKGVATLSEFENKLHLLKEKQRKHSNNSAKITLSTIHGSKGLEFDNVFLVDLIEDEFPSAFSMNSNDEHGVLEEERRLFYVGMTRAKTNLTLITLKNLHKNKANMSLFLKEIIQKN